MLKVSNNIDHYLDLLLAKPANSDVILYWVKLENKITAKPNKIIDTMTTIHIPYEKPFHILNHKGVNHVYEDKIHKALEDDWYMVSWETPIDNDTILVELI
jgi:hypothetical protein